MSPYWQISRICWRLSTQSMEKATKSKGITRASIISRIFHCVFLFHSCRKPGFVCDTITASTSSTIMAPLEDTITAPSVNKKMKETSGYNFWRCPPRGPPRRTQNIYTSLGFCALWKLDTQRECTFFLYDCIGTPCIARNQTSSQPHTTTTLIHILFRFPTSESRCLPTPYPNGSAAGRSKHYTDPQDACTCIFWYLPKTQRWSSRSITIAVKGLRVHLRNIQHIQIPSEYHSHSVAW